MKVRLGGRECTPLHSRGEQIHYKSDKPEALIMLLAFQFN